MKKSTKLRISIEVPAGGVELKLTSGGMLGTLTIEPTGIKFDGVKAKVKSDRLITWQVLKNLAKSGLI